MNDKLPSRIQKLIGTEICNGDEDYGSVYKAEAVVTNGQTDWELHTNRGFIISANQLINLLNEIEAMSIPESDEYSQHQHLPPALSDGNTKKFAWGSAHSYGGGGINNIAKIGDESINISKRPGN